MVRCFFSHGLQSSDTLSEGVESSYTLFDGVQLSDTFSEGVQLTDILSEGVHMYFYIAIWYSLDDSHYNFVFLYTFNNFCHPCMDLNLVVHGQPS